jgi:cytidylate kinase
MNRKKVKTDNTLNIEPKKREEETVKTSPITFLSNDDKIKWEKIKNVNGKIVRVKEGEGIKRKELLEKKKYRQLYVGIDGNDLYFYYEIIE